MFIIGKSVKDAELTVRGKDGSEKIIDKNISFIEWVQEYSKKIVTITFFIFLVFELASLIMVIVEHVRLGDSMHLDILITEANQTFREVIGGYIIKAAAENVSKGFGSIADRYFAHKQILAEMAYEHECDTPAMEEGEESDL